MTEQKYILDNHERNVADYLRQHLPDAKVFRLVSAYFSIYGYQLLQKELDGLQDVRFLYGDPVSVGELDPAEKDPKHFELTERGLSPDHQLQQKYLARQCEEWVQRANVQIRSVSRSNFLHGKMYLTESAQGGAAVVGSSNFTKRGMGGSAGANLEINLAASDAQMRTEMKEWFDKLWGDEARTEDVKREVLAALNRLGKNHAPEFVYYKTLFELFKDQMDALLEGDKAMEAAHLYDTTIWRTLYDFQKDGAKSVIGRLLRLNGCILADSVGLGKTYTALAVIKFFELQYNARVLVLCPKKLGDNWKIYSSRFNQKDNPFAEDEFNYHMLAHTDLSRDSGEAFGVSLENFNWSNFHLVVIDESHNFRNATENRRDKSGEIIRRSRYNRLFEDIIQKGGKTKVLMLSATPVNTSLVDLRNQIYLMTEKDDSALREHLGVGNFRLLLDAAQKKFKEWEQQAEKKNKDLLFEKLGGDFFNLLGGVSIARSRRQIKKFYSRLIEKIGDFPQHQNPQNHHPQTDLDDKLSYKDLHTRISNFSFSIYRPSSYIESQELKEQLQEEKERLHFNQKNREHYLVGMMRVNFLKRLESSAHALRLTLERTVAKIDALLDKIGHFEKTRDPSTQADVQPDTEYEDEEFLINQGRNPYHLQDLDLSRWKKEIATDREVLKECLRDVSGITPERDGKLAQIKQDIRHRAQYPTVDKDGKSKCKMLVFTTFKDTAEYLYQNLETLAAELKLNMALVAGDETQTTFGGNHFNDILTNFSPQSRHRADDRADEGEIDLLIATDCISEGQNLQDCDTVLNYDIHWNPVRLIQRFGRIDRIGSRNQTVQMINYWPTDDMDFYLNLKNRVEARMALADTAATGDEDQLNRDEYEKAQEQELNFRDKQLKKLREEVVDLDEFSNNVVLSDFSIDYFLSQLRRYLKGKEEQLKAAPCGIYALTKADAPAHRGVIFFLRHKCAGKHAGNPIQPFYITFIRDDGEVRYGYRHAKQVLDLFDSLCAGETAPLQKLCDAFDRETGHGKEMAHYNKLLEQCAEKIADTFHLYTQQQMGKSGVILPEKPQWPEKIADFELITWLIIRKNGE